MASTRSMILVALTSFCLLLTFIFASLSVAHWQPTQLPDGNSAGFSLARSRIGPTTHKVQLYNSIASTKTVYIPLIMEMPSGKWLEVWADAQRTAPLRSLAPRFKQTYNADLVVRQVNNAYEAVAAMQRGKGPDVFLGHHDGLGAWLDEGLLASIDLGAKKSDFSVVALTGFSRGGKLYGLPFVFENMALFRDADLVPNPPLTWAELLAAGQVLQEGEQVEYALALEDNGYKVYPIITSFGGYVFAPTPDGSWDPDQLGVESEGMIAAGAWVSDSVGSGLVSPIAHDANGAETLFITGQVPFLLTGPWALQRIRDSDINYAIGNFPDSGQSFAGAQGFMINAKSPKQVLARNFLVDFVATFESMQTLYQGDHRLPAYLPLLTSLNDPDLNAFLEAGLEAELMPSIVDMGCVWGPWNDAVVRVIEVSARPEQAFNEAADAIRECITYGGPFPGMVNVPGSYQSLVGCEADWDPACLTTVMTITAESEGMYVASHDLPAGQYECKVALDGSWLVNYGLGGVRNGANIPFKLVSPAKVDFTYDPASHYLSITIEPSSMIADLQQDSSSRQASRSRLQTR